MFRFSYVPGVSGRAVEVTKELFHQIIRDAKIQRICAQIATLQSSATPASPSTSTSDEVPCPFRGKDVSVADRIGALKRQLPAFCWHAWFDEGKRKNYAAHPSGLIMLDLDHVGAPRELFESMKDKCLEIGLVAAHVTPSTQGLRLVFPIPPQLLSAAAPLAQKGQTPLCNFSLEEAQGYYAKALKLKNLDACTKDLARLSFCVPEEYFLYLNEEALFEGKEQINEKPLSPDPFPQLGQGGDVALSLPQLGKGCPEGRKGASDYDGIPYPLIVASLQELMGGVPAHGSRNNFIFSMAAYLRYVCNDDPEWIASILPTYGESADKWRRTIDSACQRAQYKVIPQIVQRAIEQARKKMSAGDDTAESSQPPAMPKRLPKLIRHLIKNVPEVCRPAVANAVFPALAAHLKDVHFRLIDGTEKEATFMCVTMARQSSGKSAVNKPIEYIVADIVERDEINRKREQEWKDASANKAANKEKPKRPDDLCVQVLVSDMTNAAFVQRMKDAGGRYLYTNLEELDLLKQLQTNGTKDVGKIICLCFDNGKYGQERVGNQSVTARVELRWNWNAASTIQKGIAFFKNRLVDGTLSRVNFCTIIPDKSKPFKYGTYDEKYAEELKPFISNLNLANGEVYCKPALELAQRLDDACAEEADLSDDQMYQDMAHRAVTIAYLKAMVLYIASDMTWTREIAEFAEWSLRYDLWCKQQFFGEQVKEAMAQETVKKSRGPRNILDLLPTSFSFQDALDVRALQGLSESGCSQMINSWTFRGYITYDAASHIYIKSDKYLKRAAVK